jgi:hypothetical protein
MGFHDKYLEDHGAGFLRILDLEKIKVLHHLHPHLKEKLHITSKNNGGTILVQR